MERIQSLNPERVFWCCNERSITIEELAQNAGISFNSLESALKEGRGLTYLQLRKIAEFFHRGVLFFLEAKPVVDDQVHTPQFRTIANQKPEITAQLRALVESVERQRDIYLALRSDLGDIKKDLFQPPKNLGQNIQEAAEATRKWLGLGIKNTFTSYRNALEARHLLVFRTNGYSGKWQIAKEDPICGFTVFDPKCPVIVVKKFDAVVKQSFTLMHELGHVILHRDSFIDNEKDLWSYQGKERDANYFASYLLVPDAFLEEVWNASPPEDHRLFDDWLRPFIKAWNVSSHVILIRLINAGLIQQYKYDSYKKWKEEQPRAKISAGGNRKNRHREPRHIFGEPYVRTVLDALHNRQISLAKASTYLDNLKIPDLHKLEKVYADI